MKKIKITALILCAMLFALRFTVEAQQARKTPRIGYLTGTIEPTHDAPDAIAMHFDKDCGTSVILKGKISRLSIATVR